MRSVALFLGMNPYFSSPSWWHHQLHPSIVTTAAHHPCSWKSVRLHSSGIPSLLVLCASKVSSIGPSIISARSLHSLGLLWPREPCCYPVTFSLVSQICSLLVASRFDCDRKLSWRLHSPPGGFTIFYVLYNLCKNNLNVQMKPWLTWLTMSWELKMIGSMEVPTTLRWLSAHLSNILMIHFFLYVWQQV